MAVLLVAAENKDKLKSLLSGLQTFEKKHFSKIGNGGFRCAFVLNKNSQLKNRIEKTLELLEEQDEYYSTREGIFFSGKNYSPDNFAFVFPGQGSQYRTMLESMWKNEIFKKEFDHMVSIASNNGIPLGEMIKGSRTDLDLNDTRYAQPALAVVEWSLFKMMSSIGYGPSHLAGHSFGELAALAASGAYSREFLMSLSLKRGSLMSKADTQSPGKMLALVDPSSENWENLHDKVKFEIEKKKIELANINTHGQLVYSGDQNHIELLKEKCVQKKIKNTMLSASAAFHSSLMEPVAGEFKTFLENNKKTLKKPEIRVHSNLSGRSYESNEDIIDNLSDQLTGQVNWVEVIGSIYQSGVRIFFEVGPRTILSKMIKSLVPTDQCQVIPMDGEGDLESIMAWSVCLGIDLKFPVEKQRDYLDLETKNKIVSGFMEKQKILLDKVETISNPEMRESTREKVLEHIREVVETFFSFEGDDLGTNSPPRNHQASNEEHPVATWVKQEISRLTGFNEDEIFLDSDFDSDLSLDSITKMELFSALVGEFGKDVGDLSDFTSVSSINELVSKLKLDDEELEEVKVEKRFSEEAQWVVEEISRYTGISTSDIGLKTKFTEDLMLDSIMKMDLFSGFVKAFPEISFEMTAFTGINSLDDLEQLLRTDDNKPIKKEKFEKSDNKKFSEEFRNRLSYYLGIPSSQIQTTSNFEYDLKLNIFEKEDLMNSLASDFPYFQLAGRELLNTQTVGDLLHLETLFDRRSAERGGEEEVARFSFERVLAHEGTSKEVQFSNQILICPLLIEKGYDKIKDHLESRAQTEFVPITAIEDVNKILERIKLTKEGQSLDILFLLAPLAKLDLRSWELQMEKYIKFLYNFSKEMIHVLGSDRKINIRVLLDGSRDAFVKGTTGFFRSLTKEVDINVRVLDMVWERKEGDDIPWHLLWDQEDEDKCHHYVQSDKKYFLEKAVKGQASRKNKIQIPEEPKILILGGARGITAEISKFLADYYNAEVHAVGRTVYGGVFPLPEHPSNKELRDHLKRKIEIEFEDREQEIKNKVFNSEYDKIIKQREIHNTKVSVEKRGGVFHYHKVDVMNFHELESLIAEIERDSPLNGVIHAPGVIHDDLLVNKEFTSFEKVIKTKVQSAMNTYQLFKNRKDLSFVCFFSSLSSWSGAPGQTDYSLANEIVNVIAEHWNSKGNCPVSSLLWSVWTETGLASSSLIKQMNLLGLGGISNRAGVRLFKEELIFNGLPESKVLFAPVSTLEYSLKARSYE